MGQCQKGDLILLHPNQGELGMAHPLSEAENFLFNPIALNLFPFVKASKGGLPYTCKI